MTRFGNWGSYQPVPTVQMQVDGTFALGRMVRLILESGLRVSAAGATRRKPAVK